MAINFIRPTDPKLTKIERIAILNQVLKSYYGADTKLTKKVERLPKEAIARIYMATWLWRYDSLAEQVETLEGWVKAQLELNN